MQEYSWTTLNGYSVLSCVEGVEVETELYSRTSWIRDHYVYLLDNLDTKYSNLVRSRTVHTLTGCSFFVTASMCVISF